MAGRLSRGRGQAIRRIMQRKHAELPGEPAANNSVLLTTKVRDRDKGTENGEKQGETIWKGRKGQEWTPVLPTQGQNPKPCGTDKPRAGGRVARCPESSLLCSFSSQATAEVCTAAALQGPTVNAPQGASAMSPPSRAPTQLSHPMQAGHLVVASSLLPDALGYTVTRCFEFL